MDDDLDMCEICGGWFKQLNVHQCVRPLKKSRKELKAKIAELEKKFFDTCKLLEDTRGYRDAAKKRQGELEAHITKIAYENTSLKHQAEEWQVTAETAVVENYKLVERNNELEARLVHTQSQFDESMQVVKSWQKTAEELVVDRNKLVDKINELDGLDASRLKTIGYREERIKELEKLAYIGDTGRTYKEAQKDTYDELYKTQRALSVTQTEASKNAQERDEALKKVKELEDRVKHLDWEGNLLVSQRDDEIKAKVAVASQLEYQKNKYDDLVELLDGLGIKVFPSGKAVSVPQNF